MANIKLLFIILDEGYDKEVKAILNRFGIILKTVSKASGTASPSILDYFGLIQTEKELFMAVIPDYLCSEILDKITKYFRFNEEGTGIAFTIPIASSNKYLADSFENKKIERKELNMEDKNNIDYHLVITVVSEGFLEDVMTAAKRAGTPGGTAIKARGLSNTNRTKILGFNVEPEKDIVLNVVPTKDKTKVMEEITKEVGIKTKGMGVCMSLPIDDVIGINAN